MNKIISFLFFLFALTFFSCKPKMEDLEQVEKWDVFEIALEGPAEGSPFVDVNLSAEFMKGKYIVKVAGFYDGQGVYKIRFSPNKKGKWTYRTQSNVEDLKEKNRKF